MLKLLIPPPAWLLLFAASMWAIDRTFPLFEWLSEPWNKIGLVLIGSAFLIDLTSLMTFFKKHTTPNPFRPRKTQTIVTTGPYSFTRNPMYLGMVIILTGWGVYLGSVTPFVLIPPFVWIITVMQIIPEEDILEEKFGQEYLDYKVRVKRWI
ncbi:MAG: Isoprenylcysteine carboxyl methyltransferase [uncultured Thiotrichaceae bacterium]|uniref:Isoprenylcysteine carboxyl methyltransferase n=1 Tax=uncultured Thiotrichaceae bacterium TaxID=298394 RepID=A0A6S6SPX4_9GAMM|nr:MAG: Isoprenylcysteine carboxyl methyltransferase [uncultured Thiotrichaceae bacterium]